MESTSEPADPDRDSLSTTIDSLTTQWLGVIEAAAARHGLDGLERDDLMQRVRLRLWRALGEGATHAKVLTTGYGYRAAWSAAIDIARERRSRRAADHLPLETARAEVPAPTVPDEAEQLAALDEALGRLDQGRRIAVRLHLGGKDLKDIAELAGWTEAKARNILYRGLDELRQVLEAQ